MHEWQTANGYAPVTHLFMNVESNHSNSQDANQTSMQQHTTAQSQMFSVSYSTEMGKPWSFEPAHVFYCWPWGTKGYWSNRHTDQTQRLNRNQDKPKHKDKNNKRTNKKALSPRSLSGSLSIGPMLYPPAKHALVRTGKFGGTGNPS